MKYSLTLIAFILAFVGNLLAQSNVDNVSEALVKAGFADVRAVETRPALIVSVENDSYKFHAFGIDAALDIIDSTYAGAKEKRLIVTSYGVPQVLLTYDSAAGKWKTTYRLGNNWNLVKKAEKHNISRNHVNLVFYPQLSLKNLIITQVYQTLWTINPAVEYSPLPGMKLTAQIRIPIYNDGYGIYESKVHPGHITISQRFRAAGLVNIFGKASVGWFSASQYGAAVELMHPFVNERFSVEAMLGYVGTGYWDGFMFHYDPDMKVVGKIAFNYYCPMLGTLFTLNAQRFIGRDFGAKFEMTRHFKYCSVGFYAMKGFGAAHTNGGFRFSIALPPYGNRRFFGVAKFDTGNVGLVYNANNEQKYYREFKTEVSDNIFEHNGFNPYYINKVINR